MAKQTRQTGKKIIPCLVVAVLVAVAVVITLLPKGWQTVYSALGLDTVGQQGAESPFALHVLSVGKADALVVTCQGESMVVDCGMVDDGQQMATYLAQSGIDHLTYAVNTHPDSDHIGGFPALLQAVSANCYLEPPLTSAQKEEEPLRDKVLAVAEAKNIPVQTVKTGDALPLGDTTVEVLSPKEAGSTSNDSSLVLLVTYQDTTFLLMGDAEKEVEETLLKTNTLQKVDVLKVGHHGSDTGTTAAFLQAVQPEYAVISVGEDRNHLPKDSVLQRLEDVKTTIHRTDVSGTLVYTSDGTQVTVLTEEEN